MYGILFNCVILLVGDRLLPLVGAILPRNLHRKVRDCLLYTSDAADD